ncbi:MAG: hypothetical protein FJ303_17415 [Planctomycetes bacterium]|nr:hypothetical protein [Planctomycetota bacterium]
MQDLAFAICALLAFVLPIGFYCIILASINRRGRPLIVNGVWDSAGLLFAMSGFFLATAPMLFSALYYRAYETDVQADIQSLWMSHWLLWIVYFPFLLSGCALMILWRANKSIVYNVDAELFPKALEQTLTELGVAVQRRGGTMVLFPTGDAFGATGVTHVPRAGSEMPKPAPQAAPSGPACAELQVELFAAMCNVTLHWENYSPATREEVERELERNLESAAPYDNPSAGWFLNIAGLIFGTLFMIVAAVTILIIMARWR